MSKIIISGYGYVGKATEIASKHHWQGLAGMQIQDPFLGLVADSWDEADYHMVCVPTPPDYDQPNNRKHNVTIVRDAIQHARICGFNGTTVIRSTMSPLDFDSLSDVLGRVLVWPEFLRKSTFETDALNPLMSIVGGEDTRTFQSMLPGYRMAVVGDARTACMAKLAINSYLSMRTIVANDLRKACDSMGVNWMGVKATLASDPRLGVGHWDQPGPDGLYGFGGGCLPKDTDAMAYLLNELGFDANFASWATERNSKIR